MTFIGATDSDYAYLERLDAMRAAQRSAATNASSLVAANLIGIAQKYPGISPGLAYAYAASNQPGVADAYQAELAARLGNEPGTVRKVSKKKKDRHTDYSGATPAELADEIARTWDSDNPDKLSALFNAAGAAFAEIPKAERAAIAKAAGLDKLDQPGVGNGLDAINNAVKSWREGHKLAADPLVQAAGAGPGTATGAVAGAALAPVGGVVADAMNAGAGVHDSGPFGSGGPLHIPGLPSEKDVVRGAATTAQAGLEATVATARSLAPEGQFTDPSTWGRGGNVAMGQSPSEWASAIADQTVLGQTAQGNTAGSGWLPNPNSPAAKAQAEAARKFSPYLVGGHAWTPGRAIAGVVFEPDSDAFNIASGVVDAGVAIYADPANIGLAKLAEARALGKMWVPDEVSRAGIDLNRLDDAERALVDNVVTRAKVKDLTPQTLLERARKVDINETEMFGGEEVGRLRLLADKAWKPSEVVSPREAAGLFSGTRQRYSPKRFTESLNTPTVNAAMHAIAGESEPGIIHRATGIPYVMLDGEHLVDKLAKASTADEVASLIKPYVGVGELRTTLRWQDPGYGSRLWSNMPLPTIELGENVDINRAAQQSDLALINSRATLEQRNKIARLWAEADARPKAEKAVDTTFDVIKEQLKLHGVSEDAAHQITRHEQQEFRELANYGHDWAGNQLENTHLLVDGEATPQPLPIFENQFLNKTIQLPDARTVRRLTTPYAKLFDAGVIKDAVAFGDLAMIPWRRLMLMRPAWGVRVVAEEQIRMAAEGMSSLLSAHPLRAIGYAIGSPEDRWITKLEEMGARGRESLESGAQFGVREARDVVAGQLGKGLRNVKDQFGTGVASTFSTADTDPFILAQNVQGSRRFAAVYDETPRVYLNEFTLTRHGDEHYAQAVAEELVRMRESRIARAAVDAENPQVLKDAFWDGDLASTRKYMAGSDTFAAMGADDDAARLIADAQMDIAYQAINTVTANGNPTLVEAMRTGKIDGVDLVGRNGQINKDAVAKIQELVDSGADLPEKMRIRKWLTLNETEQKALVRKLGKATDALFNALMPRPSDYLSRSPTFKQYYWARLEELVPYMDEATRARTLEEIHFAKLDRGLTSHTTNPIGTRFQEMHDRLTALGDNAPEALISKFDVADNVAKHYALHKTKDLLYDLSNRAQISDVGRLIAPFAEAWKEIVTRWAKIAYENPRVLRRLAQGAWEVQQPGSLSINKAFGDTVTHSGGFFHQNQFGDEVVTYPGSELLTKSLIGVPIPLTGSVSGLNLIGQGMPGIGPAVQVPLSYLLPDKPGTDWISQQLFPYGRSSGNFLGAVAEAYKPAYFKRVEAFFDSPESDRMFANTVFDVARYLNSTGEYDIQGPNAQEEQNRLLADAKYKARAVYAIRALGSATLPTSPSPEWLTVDKKGNLTLAWRVANWYQKKVKETGDVTEAMDAFLNKFGVDNIFLAQSHSKVVVPAAPTTEDSSKWYRAHPELAKKYPITYGLFAPVTGEFDSATYARQFENGERRQLRPEEMVRLANARLGNYLYSQAVDAGADANTLRNLRAEITDEFPGYNSPSPIGGYKQEDILSELRRTVKDPAIRKTDAGKAVAAYFKARDEAIVKARALGSVTPFTSAKTYALRRSLWEQGEALVKQYPAFQPIWDRVFNREIK